MTDQLRQAVQQAIKDLEEAHDLSIDFDSHASRTVILGVIESLRSALNVPEANCGNIAAAPQAEPVVDELCRCQRLGDYDGKHHPLCDSAAPQAEPVGVVEIDYKALVEAAWARHKYAAGTNGCVAFKRGAEWFREACSDTHPAPAADVVRDAERWRVSNMISESSWKHPDHRTEAESTAFNAYREATGKGLNHEAATDAAIAAMKGSDHE